MKENENSFGKFFHARTDNGDAMLQKKQQESIKTPAATKKAA